jgi:hypothetical protein
VGDRLAVLDQGRPQFLADRDHPTRLPLARRVLEADGPADFPLGVVDHPPGQPGYLLGPQPCLGRQEEDDSVSAACLVLAR